LDKLEQAYEKVGQGEGPAYGSRLHSAFAEAVRTSGIPNVDVETTWTGGILSVYGYPGSVRTDVALRTAGGERVLAVWDVKTGEARLSQSRVAQ
jgi:hypothetical protein